MLRLVLLAVIFIHGILHFIGLAKAFGCGSVQQLQVPTSKAMGLLWVSSGLLFILAGIFLFQHKQNWWLIATVAVILSQVAITISWQQTKAGTLVNIIILITAILSFTTYRFENSYKKDVKENLQNNNSGSKERITEEDLSHLPPPVQKYLRYAGIVNKPFVKNVHIVFEGQMRDKGKEYFPFVSDQHNFFAEPARLFFMKGKMFGITVPGYHHYIKSEATMDIRLFGLLPVVQKSGAAMNKAETVTLFNDMCLLAPATLIDKRIQWRSINDTSVSATFTNHDISITATLLFNKPGQLINFISNDRVSVNEMKQFPFSTPVSAYKNINGYNIMSVAEAVWHYPDGDFTYGKFHLKSIEYNINPIK